jgi:hypothetical protein
VQIADALVEVVEYDDARGVQVRICTTANGEQLLRGPGWQPRERRTTLEISETAGQSHH